MNSKKWKLSSVILFLILVIPFLGSAQKEYNDELNADLIDAIRSKRIHRIRELLDAGANPSVKVKGDRSALSLAMLSFSTDLNTLTSGKPINFSQSETAKISQIVKLLIDAGADVNAKDKTGFSPLFATSPRNLFESAQMLIAAGADVNAKNNEGLSVLRYMAYNGNTEIVKVLIENGVNIDEPDDQGATPLMAAIFKGHNDVAKMLIDAGADVNIENKKGQTALILSAFKGNAEMAKILIGKTADVHHQDQIGGNALIAASYAGSAEIVDLMLDAGLDVNAKTPEGHTALILAASQGHADVVKLLLGNGAKRNIENNAGESALSLAKKYKHAEVISSLEAENQKELVATTGVRKASQTQQIGNEFKSGFTLAIVMPKDKWMKWSKPKNLGELTEFRKGRIKIAITAKDIEALGDPKRVRAMVASVVALHEAVHNQKIFAGLIPEDRIGQVLSMGLFDCAFVWLESHPWQPTSELKPDDLTLLYLSGEELDAVTTQYPNVAPAVIPASTYSDQTRDYDTIAMQIGSK